MVHLWCRGSTEQHRCEECEQPRCKWRDIKTGLSAEGLLVSPNAISTCKYLKLYHSSWKNDCDPPSPPDGALGDLGPVYNFQCHQTPPPMLQGTRALCTAFSGIKRRLCIQHTVHTPCNTPHHSSCEPNFTPLPPKWRCRGPGPCVRLPVAPLWGRVPGHARRLRRYVAQRYRTEYFSPQLAM